MKLLHSLPFCLVFIQGAAALEIRSYNAARHDRFLDFPSAPKVNPDFRYGATDLTGVGWYIAPSNTAVERRRQYTMVSPRHFVGANHFKPSTNGSLSFLSEDGVVRTYAIGTVQAILNSDGNASDLLLGTLEEEISPEDGVNFQPFLSLPDAAYIGRELIFMGHQRPGTPTLRAGRAVFQARSEFGAGTAVGGNTGIQRTEVFTWTYQENRLLFTGDANDSFTEPGDSGSPSLVDVNGRGALVGTHTAAGSASVLISNQNISYDTFVPFYVDDLNEAMAEHGYHMTRAVPGPNQPMTSLELLVDVPPLIRAGYSVTLPVTLTNTGAIEDANNLKFAQALPAASGVTASGLSWVSSSDNAGTRARKGGLMPGESSVLNVTFTPLTSGSQTSTVVFSADEFSEVTEEIDLEVIESYRSWSSDLMDGAFAADPDGDGILNLQEYAFGGDPSVSSRTNEADGGSLLPTLGMSSDRMTFNFLRRTDAAERALSYVVESSPDLTEGSWVTVTDDIGDLTPQSAGDGFERVQLEFERAPEGRYFRVKVSLNE